MSKTTFRLELPVKYAVYTVISRCHTTTSKGSSSVTLWGSGNSHSLQQLNICDI